MNVAVDARAIAFGGGRELRHATAGLKPMPNATSSPTAAAANQQLAAPHRRDERDSGEQPERARERDAPHRRAPAAAR